MVSAVLIVSIIGFLGRILEYRSAADEYAEIAQQMESTEEASELPTCTPTTKNVLDSSALSPSPVVTSLTLYNPKIASFCAKNEDTVGFIEVEGTAIKYPVLQGEDNSYYENHTFLKKKNASGAIFLDSQNATDLSDFNLIFYGHNMKDGSMFHELLQFRKATYAGEHRKITLSGLCENKIFFVFSAYTCSQNTDVRGFQYNTAKERQIFLKLILGRSVISAGSVKPTADDQIITLVTCRENSNKDYFVVHGLLME